MEQKLNVILITSHDLGRNLSCYGVPGVRSPNLDRLAADGVRFDRAFCTQSQCSPSRASIYTGRYPHSNGVMGLCHSAFAWDLGPQERHLASILREANYRTALVGLQHETCRPQDMGFNSIHIDLPSKWAPAVADKCGELIRDFAKDSSMPFYLQIGFVESHRMPGHPNHEWGPMPSDDPEQVTVPPFLVDEPSAREEIAQMHGSIHSLDTAIGRVLADVDECGLRDNTLVIFTADHGIAFPRAKTSMYDPGLEVSLLVRGPSALISGGRTFDSLISNIDIMPSILEMFGIPVPEQVQGQSFVRMLSGVAFQPRTEIFAEMTYHNYADPMRCIRTESHKLIVNFMPCSTIYNSTQQWRPRTTTVVPENPKGTLHSLLELYDLQSDPLEQRNLAEEPGCSKVRDDLLGRLSRWMHETEDPLLHGVPLPHRFREAIQLLVDSKKN